MDYSMDLGIFSGFDSKITTEWIVKHCKEKKKVVVALQFSNSNVKYAPRIQYLIEKQVNSLLSKGDGSTSQCTVRFFVLCDVLNPACCLDVLNIKKSHSDLVVHFGYSCYRNVGLFHLPVYFVPSSSNYFGNSEPAVLREIATFLHNQLKDRLGERSTSPRRTNVILSFQGILKDDLRSILVDEVLGLMNACSDREVCLYLVSPASTTDCLELTSSESICDLPLTKIGHDKELELLNLEKEHSKAATNAQNPVLFFHFISKNNTYSSLPDSFLERVVLRYNQVFEINLCQVNDSSPAILVNSAALEKLNSIISKRFVLIEKAKSIPTINRVAFIITPGITPREWKLIELFKKHKHRQNTDDGNKVLIETHIISLSGVSEVKLRNFPDIDIFCYFGCSEYFLSHITKTLNLKTPIILTPFEYQVFLGVREWSTCYLNVCDLEDPDTNPLGTPSSSTLSDSEDSEIDQHFSKLAIQDAPETLDKQLCTKSKPHSLQSIDQKTKKLLVHLNLIKHKHERTYFGLNPLENTEQIPIITQGRDGIASVYRNENK